MKFRFSRNTVLVICNLNLFVIQSMVFVFWTIQPQDRAHTEHSNVQTVNSHDDEVMVYNGGLNKFDSQEEAGEKLIGPTAKNLVVQLPKVHHNDTWDWNWDGRADQKTPGANRYIYLVRHGQYYGNGPYEKHLSRLGQQQAIKTGEQLKAYNITFHRFISSTSIRAAETTDFIHRYISYLDVEYSDELREGWPSYPDPDTPGTWDRNNPIFKNDMPRIQSAFEKYIHRSEQDNKGDCNELIVAHGNVISYIILRALQLPVSRWLKIGVLQGSITLLNIQPNGDVALRFLGDVGHLTKKEWSG